MSDFKDKMHQIHFGWRSAPDPAGGAYSAPPDPPAAMITSKERKGRRGGKAIEEEGAEGEGREREP